MFRIEDFDEPPFSFCTVKRRRLPQRTWRIAAEAFELRHSNDIFRSGSDVDQIPKHMHERGVHFLDAMDAE